MITTILKNTGRSSRLILRQFEERDLDDYADMLADPELVKFIGDGKPKNKEEAWRSMAMVLGHWHLKGFGLWAVEHPETGKLIGRVGLFSPHGWPGIEVGWMLKKSEWGKGYAIECANYSVIYAFKELGLDQVVSLIHPDNTSSIKLAKRLGMNCQGEFDLAMAKTRPLLFLLSK